MSEIIFDDKFVLSNMPHFITVNYQRLLEAQTPQERVELALHIYNLGLRYLTIGLVSQYLIQDRERVRDPYLNELLLQKFPHLTLDAWQQLLFATLRAYEGNQDLFFMPKLYDFYWDTSTLPHRRRPEVEQPFERLTQIALEHQTERLLPQNETEWDRLADETRDLLQQILSSIAFLEKYDLIWPMTIKRQRTRILHVLYEEDARGPLEALDCESLAHRMDTSWEKIRLEVTYLEEKGYIVLKNRQRRKDAHILHNIPRHSGC